MNQLEVIFIDELYTATTTEAITFGREGDVVIDESNQFMHRLVGRFVYHNDVWWLSNEGRRIEITAIVGSGTVVVLPPGESLALNAARGVVRFDAARDGDDQRLSVDPNAEIPETRLHAGRDEACMDGALTLDAVAVR